MHPQRGMRQGVWLLPVALLYILVAACAGFGAGFGAGLALSANPEITTVIAGGAATAPTDVPTTGVPAAGVPVAGVSGADVSAAKAVPSAGDGGGKPVIQPPPNLEAMAAPVSPAPKQVVEARLVHKVKRGETLWALARTYGATTAELARLNGLSDADFIMPGVDLKIPSPGGFGTNTRLDLAVPVFGPVSSGFGYRWGRLHEGIDIASTHGHPVRAAADGRVIYAGAKGTYGKLVVLEHTNYTQTWYGHMSKILVKNGQKVTRGGTIGLVGSTGHSTGPHLHFEVRVRGRPIDPSFVLGVNLSSAQQQPAQQQPAQQQPAGTSPGGSRT